MQFVAVISDIHANLPALEAVLEEIDGLGIGHILCCGDIVGYGPQSRTGDPRAAWTLWQPQARSIEFRRTPYPVEETMAAIKACGFRSCHPGGLVRAGESILIERRRGEVAERRMRPPVVVANEPFPHSRPQGRQVGVFKQIDLLVG